MRFHCPLDCGIESFEHTHPGDNRRVIHPVKRTAIGVHSDSPHDKMLMIRKISNRILMEQYKHKHDPSDEGWAMIAAAKIVSEFIDKKEPVRMPISSVDINEIEG